jgi:hypothetical protein
MVSFKLKAQEIRKKSTNFTLEFFTHFNYIIHE